MNAVKATVAAVSMFLLAGCATMGTTPLSQTQQFPERPESAPLMGSQVIEVCPGEKSVVYIQQYDVNPDTQAVYVTVNLLRETREEFLIAVVTVDDAGATAVHAGSKGEIRKFTLEEFLAEHPESWCDFAGEHKTAQIRP